MAQIDYQWRAFFSESCQGDVHFIHQVFKKEDFLKKYHFTDEYDHSVIYRQGTEVYVRWFNHRGEFQFCGTGAFCIGHLLEEKGLELKIKGKFKSATFCQGKLSFLEKIVLPRREKLIFPKRKHFFNLENQVHLIEVSPEELRDFKLTQEVEEKYEEQKAGALVLFNFSLEKKRGLVRYFTPWYGRREDIVTGSVHQYLTPLVNQLYQVEFQQWEQCSEKGGLLQTEYRQGHVFLAGICRQE